MCVCSICLCMYVYIYIYVWVFSLYLYIYICNIFRVTTYGVMWCVVNAPDLKWLVQPVHFRTTRRISSAPQPHESGVAGTLKDIIVEWGASWNSWDCSGFHGIYIYIYIYFIPFLITLYLSFFFAINGIFKVLIAGTCKSANGILRISWVVQFMLHDPMSNPRFPMMSRANGDCLKLPSEA